MIKFKLYQMHERLGLSSKKAEHSAPTLSRLGLMLVRFKSSSHFKLLCHHGFMFVDEHVFDQLLMRRLCETLAKAPPFHKQTVTCLVLGLNLAEGTSKILKKEFF